MKKVVAANEFEAGDMESADDRPAQKSLGIGMRYVVAAGCVLLAFGIRYWLSPMLGGELPFMFFIAAALVATWCGGAAVGIAALVLGFLLADYFFLPGKVLFDFSKPIQEARIVQYLLTASIGIALIEVLHRGKRRTEQMVAELRREIARRKRSEAALLETKRLLSEHANDLEQRVADRTAHLQATISSLESVLYEMSHSLRAPLRAMNSYAAALVEEYAPRLDERALDYSSRISSAAARMDVLIHDLLAYGALGHVEVKLSRLSLSEHTGTVLRSLAAEMQAKGAHVQVHEPLPEAWADSELVEQALFNLLSNAVRFARPGIVPEIQIRAETHASAVRLWIEDNGIGIEPQYHQRIFQPFVFLRKREEVAGTGMGLAIVAKAMERMRGKVGVESKPGEGSRFWLEFQLPPQSDFQLAERAWKSNHTLQLEKLEKTVTATG